MRISDWSSDVCSSDLIRSKDLAFVVIFARFVLPAVLGTIAIVGVYLLDWFPDWGAFKKYGVVAGTLIGSYKAPDIWLKNKISKRTAAIRKRSEEHTSELQSLMRTSYAVFCLKKKKTLN